MTEHGRVGAFGSLVNRHVGARLHERRVACGISVESVCAVLSVEPGVIADWESGHSLPHGVNLLELADLYSVSAEYFYEGLRDIDGRTSPSLPDAEPRS